jgi:flagellar biosynthesis protein FlhG
MRQVVAVTSGKGGAGKTTIAVQVALAHARRGQRVALVDAAFGLASADLAFGQTSIRDLADVLTGRAPLADVLVEVADDVALVPGTSGSPELADMAPHLASRFADVVERLAAEHDVVVLDTLSGFHGAALLPLSLADRVVVVLTTDPSAIVGGYSVARLLGLLRPGLRLDVAVNLTGSEREGRDVFWRLRHALIEGLGMDARYLASISEDPLVRDALAMATPLQPRPQGRGAAGGFWRLERALFAPEPTDEAPPADVIPLRGAPRPAALSLVTGTQE